jgi:hypothetical protein
MHKRRDTWQRYCYYSDELRLKVHYYAPDSGPSRMCVCGQSRVGEPMTRTGQVLKPRFNASDYAVSASKDF